MPNLNHESCREKIIEFLAKNAIYPMVSRKGKIYLRPSKKKLLSEQQVQEIISSLGINDSHSCKLIRDELKQHIATLRLNTPIKEWIEYERPREILLKHGAKQMSLSKLFAIILCTGKEGVNAEELSKRLLNKFGTLRSLDIAPVSEICKIEGIGPAKAAQIKAALEIGKRLLKEKALNKKRINGPDDVIDYVAEYFGPYFRDAKKEFFHIILMDTKNKPIHNIEISKGSINASIVDPKDIIKEATLKSSTSIILVHNHPSGETKPSSEDINLTNRIIKACNLVEIRVLDHIIIGKNQEEYFSFAKAGLIKETK